MDITCLENKLFVANLPTGVATYDFNFELHFSCTHPYFIEGEEPCVLRLGAIAEYEMRYQKLLSMGLRAINSPQDHILASELESWYPHIRDLTPHTRVYEELPNPDDIESEFKWPVFLKGSRQTSKHNPDLSVISNREQYLRVMDLYASDPILHWQKPVIREFIQLVPVQSSVAGKVKPAVEYRSFWYQGMCVGWGQYWYQLPHYQCSNVQQGLDLAREAAVRLEVPFLVIDIAKKSDGKWTIIECNDAQESGYTGVIPYTLWRKILEIRS